MKTLPNIHSISLSNGNVGTHDVFSIMSRPKPGPGQDSAAIKFWTHKPVKKCKSRSQAREGLPVSKLSRQPSVHTESGYSDAIIRTRPRQKRVCSIDSKPLPPVRFSTGASDYGPVEFLDKQASEEGLIAMLEAIFKESDAVKEIGKVSNNNIFSTEEENPEVDVEKTEKLLRRQRLRKAINGNPLKLTDVLKDKKAVNKAAKTTTENLPRPRKVRKSKISIISEPSGAADDNEVVNKVETGKKPRQRTANKAEKLQPKILVERTGVSGNCPSEASSCSTVTSASVEEKDVLIDFREIAQPPSKIKPLSRTRRLSLNSRISLRQAAMNEVEKTRVGKMLQWWAGVELPGVASEMRPDELDSLVKNYKTLHVKSAEWIRYAKSVPLDVNEEQRLGSLIQPAKRLDQVRELLVSELGREPLDSEWAKAADVSVHVLKRQLELREAARNKLLQHHINLVLKTAHTCHNRLTSLTFKDLCQLGVKGLLEGTDKWKPGKGVRFMGYIRYWIRNAILRGMSTSGYFVRATSRLGEEIMEIRRVQSDLQMEIGRPPTVAQIAEKVGMKPQKCHAALLAFGGAYSLNYTSPITGEELVNQVTKQGRSDLKELDNMSMKSSIEDVLFLLKPKESLTLQLRFGLNGQDQLSLAEVSRVMNCSRETVRKYEMQALQKLREPEQVEILRNSMAFYA